MNVLDGCVMSRHKTFQGSILLIDTGWKLVAGFPSVTLHDLIAPS